MIVIFLVLIILASLHAALALWGWKVNQGNMWKGEIRLWFGGIFAAMYVLLALASILLCFRWQIGTDTRTGYIYSVDEEFGRGTVHIRLSENAGEDSQKPFCVYGENLEKARNLAGSGKKVIVTLPATGIHFENDFFACTYDAIIEEVKNER